MVDVGGNSQEGKRREKGVKGEGGTKKGGSKIIPGQELYVEGQVRLLDFLGGWWMWMCWWSWLMSDLLRFDNVLFSLVDMGLLVM